MYLLYCIISPVTAIFYSFLFFSLWTVLILFVIFIANRMYHVRSSYFNNNFLSSSVSTLNEYFILLLALEIIEFIRFLHNGYANRFQIKLVLLPDNFALLN